MSSKRLINVASFTAEDVSKSHRLTMLAGAALMAVSAALALVGSLNFRAASDARGAARQLSVSAALALQGTQSYLGGGADRLGLAVTFAPQLASAYADLLNSADSPAIASSIKSPSAAAYTAWNALSGSLATISGPVGQAAELSDGLGRSAGLLSQIGQRLEPISHQGGAAARAYESASRLYAYAEAGFGIASIPRVDFYLQSLPADLAALDLKQEAGMFSQLAQSAHTLATKPATKEQLSAVFDAASQAKAAADNLGAAAGQASAGMMLSIAAFVAGVFSALLFTVAFRRIVAEFGARFAHALKQFRGSEQARDAIASSLRAALAGDVAVQVPHPGKASELESIVSLLNQLMAHRRDESARAVGTLEQGAQFGSDVYRLADEAAVTADEAQAEFARAVAELEHVARGMAALDLDAKSVASAVIESIKRCSSAARVAQDATARLEAMRDGLQETSKRIKRVGESSQEIGQEVEVFGSVAERIAVLALNASLEAERAGDAGNGFRLLAKELGKLARSSSEGHERMITHVQGVQADARSAAESVEKTTSQVVAGANVGAISHASLSALAPLAESMGEMVDALRTRTTANKGLVDVAIAATAQARNQIDGIAGQVAGVRAAAEDVRTELTSGLHALQAPTLTAEVD